MEDYKYCPRCGAEYDADIEECADCFVKLVSANELREARAGAQAEEPQEAVIHITGDQGEAGELARELQAEGISVRVDLIDTRAAGMTFRPGRIFHIVVPAEEEEKARFVLQYHLSAGQPGCGLCEQDTEKTRRLETAIKGGEEWLPALAEFFGEASDLRIEALRAALEFEEAGRDLVAGWVIRICREHELQPGLMQAVGDACFMLGAEHPEWAAAELEPELVSGDSWVRKNFCFALGKLGTELAIPALVSALRDPDPQVRSEAIDHLYNFEHSDFGFEPDFEPAQQPEALARWEKLASGLK